MIYLSILIFALLLITCTWMYQCEDYTYNKEKYNGDIDFSYYNSDPIYDYDPTFYQIWNIPTRSTRNMSYDLRGDPPPVPYYIPLHHLS